MEERTGLGMKDYLSLAGLGWKKFNSLRLEENEPTYTYNDKCLRWFVRQSIKSRRICAFNQYYKSKFCDDILRIISEELNVRRNIYDMIGVYLKYKNKHLEIIKNEYGSKFYDCQKEDEEEKEIYIKLSKSLLIHQLIKQIKLDDLLWGFDAVSLYPSAMWDENNIYPRIETGYAYIEDMNDELVENSKNQIFTQGSAFLKIKYCNPKRLTVQHLPVKERVYKVEVNRMRNGYFIDTLTIVDIQEFVKIGGKVIEICEGVIYQEKLKVSPFREVIDNLFSVKHTYKDENNDITQLLVELFMNCLYGEQIRKDIEECFACKSEYWMLSENDERAKE